MQSSRSGKTLLVLAAVAMLAAGCASRTVPPPAATPAHPDFLYPTIPAALQKTFAAQHVDLGWRYLQIDDLRSAEREFGAALKSNSKMYPAYAGQGLVALARRDFTGAVAAFNAALAAAQSYVPALVGRGQALLALGRESEALAAFDAALAKDSSLTDVRQRAELLRFRGLQEVIESARSAAKAGRIPDARAAYERAIAASPDSAFLYRELGVLERRAGNSDQALSRLQKATALDPLDEVALVQLAELLEAGQDFVGAEAAYRKAVALNPSPELESRLAAATKNAREAKLPPQFKAALSSAQLTRGELAALIAVRLEPLVRAAPKRQVVVTDTRGHWAAAWIAEVTGAGILDPFENHTFQPGAIVRRGDLATAVSRMLAVIASSDPALRARLAERPAIADMNQRHNQYPAAAAAVSSGVMPLDSGRFQVGRVVSGSEAVDVLDKVRALSARVLNAGL